MNLSFIKLRIFLFIAVLVLFISVFANRLTLAKGQTPVLYDPTSNNLPPKHVYTTNLSGTPRDVFQKVNFQRKRFRLKPLFWHEELARLAYDYSETMASEGFFDHVDKDGNTLVERAADYDLKDWQKLGENLFQCYGYKDPAEIAVGSWLNSPSHRDNIYDPEWTHTGIGVYKTSDGEVFVTQIFMRK